MKKSINKNTVIQTALASLLLSSTAVTFITYNTMNNKLETANSENHVLEQKYKSVDKDYRIALSNVNKLEQKGLEYTAKIDGLTKEKTALQNEKEALAKEVKRLSAIPTMNSSNVASASNVTSEGLTVALKGTGLENLAPSFVEAEKTYDVNAIFLTSLIALESYWGNSDRAKYQNNLSGYAVYNNTAPGRTFGSKHESVMETAKLLRNNYINQGLHSVSAINNKYSADNGWTNKIVSIASDIKVKSDLNKY